MATSIQNGKRIDIAGIRREQVVDAAVRIVADRGIQSLSLSEIEAQTGMSRGQLTYYFPSKEDILLAVFDRMVRLMRERVTPPGHCAADLPPENATAWERARFVLRRILSSELVSDFARLQYTFLAQIGHRDDFRNRLADLYGEWRNDLANALAGPQAGDAEREQAGVVASYFQALLHGLVMQLEADPKAFSRSAMLEFCLERLQPLLDSSLGKSWRPTS